MPSSQIYPLSLHDALPISKRATSPTSRPRNSLRSGERTSWSAIASGCCPITTIRRAASSSSASIAGSCRSAAARSSSTPVSATDRKSTRLNSSHITISYAVLSDLPSFPTRRSSDLEESYEPNFEATKFFAEWREDVVERHREWMLPHHYDPASGKLKLSIHSWLVQVGGRTILVDACVGNRSEEHTSELQSHHDLVCRPLRSTLFPYTTLFRSRRELRAQLRGHEILCGVARGRRGAPSRVDAAPSLRSGERQAQAQHP